MDRRRWLWRRKSSEKTPGDTESSGSVSSPSERFSDDQVISIHKHSPDITSKATLNEELTEKTKSLTEQLSAALLTISANEELVKQHAKVAEEAVTGWEKAERELSALNLQHDATVKKNSALEERVGHLDGALKECVRQLRQAREEQEKKLEEIIAKRTREWESRKSELESQLIELSSQLEAAKSEAASFRPKLDATEKENKFLRIEIGALSKKLEVRTLERDFSTQTAESASKQHLDSIKKLGKLEAECRKLRSFNLKSSFAGRSQTLEVEANKINDADSSQSVLRASPSQVILMDDFLEMEKFAALPDKGDRTTSPPKMHGGEESALKAELETMINRMTDLEDKIQNLEVEKGKLEMALSESKAHLEVSKQQEKDTKERSIELESRLSECEAQLKVSDELLKTTNTELMRVQNQLIEWQDQLRTSHTNLNAAENELIELQTQLIEREDLLNSSQVQLKDAESNLLELQIQLIERDIKIKASQGQANDMEARLMELQTQLRHYQAKLKASEEQLKDTNNMLVDLQAQLALTDKLKHDVESELQASSAERERAELQVKALKSETNSLLAKIKTLVDEAEKEQALSAAAMAKCQRLEDELSKRSLEVDPHLQHPVSFKPEKKAEQEMGLVMAAGKLADCQKTIASLGKQLKSLATLDNFLVDSDNPLEFSKEVFFRTNEPGKVPCIDCQ